VSTVLLSAGDAFPLTFAMRDSQGQPVTPPGGSTATFRMRGRVMRTVVTGSATISGDQVTWTPSPTDTAVPDIYDGQFTITYPDTTVRRMPTKVGASSLSGLVIEVCPSP